MLIGAYYYGWKLASSYTGEKHHLLGTLAPDLAQHARLDKCTQFSAILFRKISNWRLYVTTKLGQFPWDVVSSLWCQLLVLPISTSREGFMTTKVAYPYSGIRLYS